MKFQIRNSVIPNMALLTSEELTKGWEFKPTEDKSPDSWLSVAKVPTTVHLDLLDNKKYDVNALKNYETDHSYRYNVEYPILPVT